MLRTKLTQKEADSLFGQMVRVRQLDLQLDTAIRNAASVLAPDDASATEYDEALERVMDVGCVKAHLDKAKVLADLGISVS